MGIGERRLYWEVGEYKKTFLSWGTGKQVNLFVCVGGGGGGNF